MSMNDHGLLDQHHLAIEVPGLVPTGVFAIATKREAYSSAAQQVWLDMCRAHPDVLAAFAARHSSENTASTSALLAVLNTLCAITKAVRNRSYVIAAAVTSESGSLSASISSTLESNAVLSSFLVMGAIEVVEINWEYPA